MWRAVARFEVLVVFSTHTCSDQSIVLYRPNVLRPHLNLYFLTSNKLDDLMRLFVHVVLQGLKLDVLYAHDSASLVEGLLLRS